MNVLSLFDGMSCGRIALERAGIPVENYFASEIDKYAMKVSADNYPEIQQLGTVENWPLWGLPKIDLMIAGSPCQGFSFAGKQLAFDDPRSKLFFEFLKALKCFKPKYFMLENVRMKKEFQDVISEYLGVEPIRINSALVSAQNRDRWYWTNIPNIEQPENKGTLIFDILEDPMIPVIKSHGEYALRAEKAMCIDANYWKGPGNHGQRTILLECEELGKANIKGQDMLKRVYSIWGKCPTLTAVCGGHQEKKIAMDGVKWRKLTPIECERLQTVPDNYTDCVSNSQRYKMLGNGWTVDVIAHIFKGLK